MLQFKSEILSNQEIAPAYWRIRLSAPPSFVSAKPGQFIMVQVSDSISPLLRRPFGVFNTGTDEQPWFEMLYKVVGKGTALLASHHTGEIITVIYFYNFVFVFREYRSN